MTDHPNSSAESCDLKPCPFCGGKGAITLGVTLREAQTVDVICQDCGGTMPAFCEEDAVGDWNKRVDGSWKLEVEALEADVARLEQLLEKAKVIERERNLLREAIDQENEEIVALKEQLERLTGAPAQPSVEAMKAAVELEIHAALGRVQTIEIGRMIQKAIDASQPSPAATVEVSKEMPADMRPIVSALKGRFFECGGHMREMSENEAFDIALALRRAKEAHERCSAVSEPAAWLSTGDNHHGLWREKPDLGDGFQVQPLYLRDVPQGAGK